MSHIDDNNLWHSRDTEVIIMSFTCHYILGNALGHGTENTGWGVTLQYMNMHSSGTVFTTDYPRCWEKMNLHSGIMKGFFEFKVQTGLLEEGSMNNELVEPPHVLYTSWRGRGYSWRPLLGLYSVPDNTANWWRGTGRIRGVPSGLTSIIVTNLLNLVVIA